MDTSESYLGLTAYLWGRRHGSGAADARGPFELGPRRGLLAGRQGAGVGIGRQDGQAVGRRHGSSAADARS